MSSSSAATSTPVTPPPTITNDSSARLRASSRACSAISNSSTTRARSVIASTMVLKGRACRSAPGTPYQFVTLPTATTSVSHDSSRPLWSVTTRRSRSMRVALFLWKRMCRWRAMSRSGQTMCRVSTAPTATAGSSGLNWKKFSLSTSSVSQ